ncbi:MAG: hypothetical protein KAJ49_03630 [Arcobacteraceae bacterium]|nr:hypothetical protein [Arcobacteraceae bacterium]
MSLKENVSFIKEEISTQEKFFENFFKIEKLYKKYKIALFGVLALGIGLFIVTSLNSYLNDQNTIKANRAYSKVLQTPTDKVNLAILKDSNQKLFEIASYQTSTDKTANNNIVFIKEITLYNKAIKENDIKGLNALILNPDFVLKDFALFNKALILSDKGDYLTAKETLKIISEKSQVTPLADMLRHYLLTK